MRTAINERATYERDDEGRIVVLTRDLENDGSIDVVHRRTFEDDRLILATTDSLFGLSETRFRYDAAGNVGTSKNDSEEFTSSWEEYDYSCW